MDVIFYQLDLQDLKLSKSVTHVNVDIVVTISTTSAVGSVVSVSLFHNLSLHDLCTPTGLSAPATSYPIFSSDVNKHDLPNSPFWLFSSVFQFGSRKYF